MKNQFCLFSVAIAAAFFQPSQLGAQTPEGRVLQEYPVYPTESAKYQVVMGPCGEVFCPVRVSVVNTEVVLDFPVWEEGLLANATLDNWDKCWRNEADLRKSDFYAWAVLCAQPVRLEASWNGLILTHTIGGDLPGQEHHLIAVLGDTLARLHVWGPNIGGPTFNRIRVADADGDGVEEIANVTGYTMPGHYDDVIDQWDVRTFGWDTERGELLDLSDTERAFRAYATILGSFETLAEAREFQVARDSCLPYDSQVLRSADLPLLRPGWYVLALMTTDRDEAFKQVEETRECVAPTVGYVRRAK